MKNDIIIRGNIESEIFISTNVEDTAFCIKVSDVYPNGDAYHLRENITSISIMKIQLKIILREK